MAPAHLLPSVFEAPPEEFVLALHDYEPPSASPLPSSHSSHSLGGSYLDDKRSRRQSTQQTHVCLAFQAGDRIRVLNRDASGWWDGELLVADEYVWREGEDDPEGWRTVKVMRGWFPSNFVEDADGRTGARELPPRPSTQQSDYSTSTSLYPSSGHSRPSLAGVFAGYDPSHRRPSEVSATSDSSYRSYASSSASGMSAGSSSMAAGSSPYASERGTAAVGSTRRGGAGTMARMQAQQQRERERERDQQQQRSQSSLGYYPSHGYGQARLGGGSGRSGIEEHRGQSSYGSGYRPDRSFSTDTTTSASSSSTAGQGYDLEHDVEKVLEPILQAIALVKAAVISRRHAHFQPSTACVISSIRSLLAATNCLSRDSPLLVQHPALGKIRKTILANLAELVALARSASQQVAASKVASPDMEEDEMREMEMEGMLKASEETLANVREFLRMVVRCGESLPERRNGEYPLVPSGHAGTSAATSTSSAGMVKTRTLGGSGDANSSRIPQRPLLDTTNRSQTSTSTGPGSPRHFAFPSGEANRSRETSDLASSGSSAKRDRKSTLHAKSMGDMRMAHKRHEQAGSVPDVPPLSAATSASSSAANSDAGRGRVPDKRREQVSISSVSSTSSSRDSSSESGAGPVTPSNSLMSAFPGGLSSSSDVLAAVRQNEDHLLSVIAALIGHAHSHTAESHPSSLAQLIDLTRETVDRVKELLTLVESVLRRYGSPSPTWAKDVKALDTAQTSMYDTSGKLVANVERLAAPHSSDGDEDGSKAAVIQAATATLRIGATCISLVKVVATRPDFANTSRVQPAVVTAGDDDGYPKQDGQASHAAALLRKRNKAVGSRGEHTLSALGRKASNLESLHLKYERDGFLAPSADGDSQPRSAVPSDSSLDEDEEEEEEVMLKDADEEDMTVQAGSGRSKRPSLLSAHSSPLMPNGASPVLSATPVAPSRRTRANSMSSPATPRLIQHRSPSRSADLNLLGGDMTFAKTPRQSDDGFDRRSSVTESLMSDVTTTTPKPPSQQEREARIRLSSNNLEVPALSKFVMPLSQKMDSQPIDDSGHTATDMRMWLVAHDYSPKEISFNTEGQIIGATLEVLVEKMTPQDTLVDPTFWETFFLTFRLFTTPARLLDALELRYDLAPPGRMPLSPATIKIWNERKVMPVRLRIFNFLKSWLENHWQKETDGEIVGALHLFIEERLCKSLPMEAPRLRELLVKQTARPASTDSKGSRSSLMVSQKGRHQRFQSGSPTSPLYATTFFNAAATTSLPPTPIMGKQLFNSLRNGSLNIHITDFHALELSRQLTLMESKLFGAILPEDLLRTAKKRAESLTAMSTLSNRITGWVADNILNEQDAKKRTALLKFFIKLADRCLGLNNYSTMFAVLAGLNSSTIMRLKKTWNGLSTKYRNIMDTLRILIEHTRNHNNYRTRLRSVEGPALPFLGLILSDITFTSDGNPNMRPSTLDAEVKLINWDKYVKLGRIAMEFQRYQMPYNLAVLPDAQHWLERVLAEKGSSSIDALYRKSLVLEPRQGSESIPSSMDKPGWLHGRI